MSVAKATIERERAWPAPFVLQLMIILAAFPPKRSETASSANKMPPSGNAARLQKMAEKMPPFQTVNNTLKERARKVIRGLGVNRIADIFFDPAKEIRHISGGEGQRVETQSVCVTSNEGCIRVRQQGRPHILKALR